MWPLCGPQKDATGSLLDQLMLLFTDYWSLVTALKEFLVMKIWRIRNASLVVAVGALTIVAACGRGAATRAPAPIMRWQGADWLERAARATEEEPERLLDILDLKPGQTVADLGAGTGYYSRRIALRVGPQGRVLAVDVQPRMLELIDQFAARENIANIETILGEDGDPKLPTGSVDWILLVDVYHEIQEPQAMLAHLRATLRPNGRIALVEYRLEGDTAEHIRPEHRMSVEQIQNEWEAAGFELVELDESLPSQHLVIFRNRSR